MPEMATKRVNVMFAGGGTGGHLFPGIAVARELTRRHSQIEVIFVGSGKHLESRVLSNEGFIVEKIRTSGLVGKRIWNLMRGLVLIPVSFFDSAVVLYQRCPKIVVGLGGYSSGPVLMLASLCGFPTILLEQNIVPGLTNRLLSRLVSIAVVSSKFALRYFPRNGLVCGNPVRDSFFKAPRSEYSPSVARILILGGSQGSHAINKAMLEAASILARCSRPIHVTHQTGIKDVNFVADGYRAVGLNAHVDTFFDDVDRRMAEADLVVCRAGAMTLAELAASGRPAILIPLPNATHDHQYQNAVAVVKEGGAELIEQKKLSGSLLGNRIVALATDDEYRSSLATASRNLARPDATTNVVDCMEQYIPLGDQGLHGKVQKR
tara:strand:- start:24987 stop:26120 length:1134 start_codon:yes stop_codon:yes gene_type:complete